jgi:protein-S-isoprenylcysteine O-methyltransferase Ste14
MKPTLLPPPVAAALAAAGMAWTAEWPAWGQLTLAGRHTAAMLLWAAGLTLMLTAAWTLRRARTTLNPIDPERARHLVTHGLFARSRNPIYLADVLLLLGWALWLGQTSALLWLAAFVLWIDRWQIGAEERALTALFGDGYRAYCARVRRWL